MAKKLNPEDLIESFQSLSIEQQLKVKAQIDNILSEKKKEAKILLEKLQNVDEIEG